MSIEIIAELAQGFEGRPEQARLLLKAAAASEADAAKFQLVYADELATPDYKYYQLFRSLEMPDDIWKGLATYATELGIQLQLDIFGPRSLGLAARIGASGVKLHGTDIANVDLLHQVANSPVKKVLLGAGGAHASELHQAIDILREKSVVVLLGFQGYPTPVEGNQIDRVRLVVKQLENTSSNVAVGFADHALPNSFLSYAIAAVAVGAGAKVLEKHLTLGRIMKLEDHESGLNPDEFLDFTQTIRSCYQALGAASDCEDYGMSESEHAYRKAIRRHAVANRDLHIGTVVSPSDLTLKRTSAEQVITELALIYQKRIKREIGRNSPVAPGDID